MEVQVISKVARMMRSQNTKDPVKTGKLHSDIKPIDSVVLSNQASRTLLNTESTQFEKEHRYQIERLKALIENNNYEMNENMVEDIAERIAGMFIQH